MTRLWLGRNPKKIESASAAATWMSWSGGRAGENGPDTFNPAVVAENSPIAELALTGAPVAMFQHAGSDRVNVAYPAAQRRDRLARSAGLARTSRRCISGTNMSLSQLLKPDAVMAALRVNGKKQALQEMSERAALVSGLPAREIFDALLQRERLGSTGVGDGVAIPHGKLAKCPHIFGIFARLDRPIDFEAPDGLPVDLIFMLIAPEAAGADHLKALAMSARLLRNAAVAAQLRATRDPTALYALLTMAPTSNAA